MLIHTSRFTRLCTVGYQTDEKNISSMNVYLILGIAFIDTYHRKRISKSSDTLHELEKHNPGLICGKVFVLLPCLLEEAPYDYNPAFDILIILPRSCQDIQDLTKKSKIDSKNIFVEHVVLLQATFPETDQCPYSEVEALC